MPDHTNPEAALALELVGQFFANQIDAGAVLREEIAAHIRTCADRVAEQIPEQVDAIQLSADRMIARLPAGWAEGDSEWSEPA